MDYFIICLIGFACGAGLVFFLMEKRRRELTGLSKQHESQRQKNLALLSEVEKEREGVRQYQDAVNLERLQFEGQRKAYQDAVNLERLQLEGQRKAFDQRVVSFSDLENENRILRQDLSNLDVEVRKLKLDGFTRDERQSEVEARVKEVGARYMKDSVNWISKSLNTNNFVQCKQRLQDTIQRCRRIGFEISSEEEETLIAELRSSFEKAVRAAFEREEQARIKSQIREEQAREKEIERELKQLERERAAIQAALEKALAEAEDEHSEEVERLRERLIEAEEKAQRTISQAQLTKSGHVYVISNIGSFGNEVFKIGMTRRLQPQDRVKELGDASVPFPFDVHMMISCDDAPTLENALHRALHHNRLNKINLRKEFFRTSIDEIRDVVKEHQGEVEYVADPEALQYRQSIEMADEDQEFIEQVYDELEDDAHVADD